MAINVFHTQFSIYYAMQQSTEKQLREIQWQRLISWDNIISKAACVCMWLQW